MKSLCNIFLCRTTIANISVSLFDFNMGYLCCVSSMEFTFGLNEMFLRKDVKRSGTSDFKMINIWVHSLRAALFCVFVFVVSPCVCMCLYD